VKESSTDIDCSPIKCLKITQYFVYFILIFILFKQIDFTSRIKHENSIVYLALDIVKLFILKILRLLTVLHVVVFLLKNWCLRYKLLHFFHFVFLI